MMSAPIRAFDAITRLLQLGGAVVLAFMAVTITYDALMRYFFAAPTSWSLEINSFLVVYLALMTAADVERRGEHIGITMFHDSRGPRGRRILTVLIALVGATFCGILAWRGYLLAHDAFAYSERVSSALGTPNWIPYSMLPIGFGTLGLQFLLNIVRPPENDAEQQSYV